MYIRLKHSKKAKHPTMQIVEGVREGAKVRKRLTNPPSYLGCCRLKSHWSGKSSCSLLAL
jgi:hypothetical protein